MIGIVAVVLIAVTIALAVAAGGDDSNDGLPSPPGPSGVPNTPSPDQTIPDEAPEGVRWEAYNGVLLPYSDSAGPREVTAGPATGFQRSPTGALIALVQIPNRIVTSPGDQWRSVLNAQVLPGPGRDALATALEQVRGDQVPPPPGGYGQTAGFRFVTYTPDVAVIQLVSRFPDDGSLQVVTETVRWSSGDWKLELQPDGASTPTTQSVRSLDGFVPWGGI